MTTTIFLLLIIGCALVGIFFKNGKYIIQFSNTTITLGVLGTFVGIFIGLKNFDVNQIQESIPILLEGLKTAFITSIAGMVSSLILRIINTHFPRTEWDISDDPTQLQRSLLNEQKNTIETLKSIQKGICGEDTDSSLLNQMKLMRTTLTDEIKTLNTSFKEFTQRQANDNTEAIMKALENVISEFKVAIEDKLSDSFKEFSIACKHLYDWQTQHKDEIEAVHRCLNETISTIKSNEVLLQDISNNQNALYGTNKTLLSQLQSLQEHSNLLNELKSKWPLLINTLQEQVSDMSAKILEASSSSAQNIKTASSVVETETKDIISGATERIQEALSEMDRAFIERFEKLINGLFNPLAAIVEKVTDDYVKIQEIYDKLNHNNQ